MMYNSHGGPAYQGTGGGNEGRADEDAQRREEPPLSPHDLAGVRQLLARDARESAPDRVEVDGGAERAVVEERRDAARLSGSAERSGRLRRRRDGARRPPRRDRAAWRSPAGRLRSTR